MWLPFGISLGYVFRRVAGVVNALLRVRVAEVVVTGGILSHVGMC